MRVKFAGERTRKIFRFLIGILTLACLTAGCATSDYRHREATYEWRVGQGTVLQSLNFERRWEDEILRLNPEKISERDIKEVLGRGPAPRIINLHGGVPLVYRMMESFSQFLIGMGYPESRIRNPQDGSYSYSPYKSSTEIAGIVAWYYEKEGMRPILVGHSAGGIQVVKVLHELAGNFQDKIAVWNPLTEEREDRHEFVDPLTGKATPVVGLRLGYATAVGAGGLARLLPNHWGMFGRLRSIPDSVERFTGASIGVDLIGGDFFGSAAPTNRYAANGNAQVRNVSLPASYNHVTVPTTDHLAEDQKIRDWINAYQPTERPQLNAEFQGSTENIFWAADVWYSIKRQWCLEAQRLVRAKRAALLP